MAFEALRQCDRIFYALIHLHTGQSIGLMYGVRCQANDFLFPAGSHPWIVSRAMILMWEPGELGMGEGGGVSAGLYTLEQTRPALE